MTFKADRPVGRYYIVPNSLVVGYDKTIVFRDRHSNPVFTLPNGGKLFYSEENEDNWYDTSGPVLLIDRDFKTLDELRKTVMDFYPDMDLCTLRVIRVSAETVCL